MQETERGEREREERGRGRERRRREERGERREERGERRERARARTTCQHRDGTEPLAAGVRDGGGSHQATRVCGRHGGHGAAATTGSGRARQVCVYRCETRGSFAVASLPRVLLAWLAQRHRTASLEALLAENASGLARRCWLEVLARRFHLPPRAHARETSG